MKATFSENQQKPLAYDKTERVRKMAFNNEVSVIARDGSRPVIARFYGGTVCHCLVWLPSAPGGGPFYGKTGGYGYHKQSAALADALENAGFRGDETISGCGHSAMERALWACSEALGADCLTIINAQA